MTRWRRACLAVAAATLSAGCAADKAPPDTQPAPDTRQFSDGVFNDIPRYPRSQEAGPRSETSGVVAQSFRAEGATPEGVLTWYRGNLAGWSVHEPVSRIGVGTYRGRWARDDRFLVVSATRAPTLSGQDPETIVTQYSLSLEPRA